MPLEEAIILQRIKKIISDDLKNQDHTDKLEKVIFEIILNSVKDMVYLMRVEEGDKFRYIYANGEAVKHAQLSDSNLGQTLQEVLEPNLAKKLQNHYEEVVRRNEPLTFQSSTLIDGVELNAESILTPIMDNEGKCRFVVSVTRNNTETVLEKRRLVESQQRYRSLVEHNMDGILTLTENGIILQSNPSNYSIMGYTERELKFLKFTDFLSTEDVRVFESLLENTLNGVNKDNINCQIIHKSGQTIFTQMKLVPIIIHDQITGVYCIVRDISEQVRNDEVIRYIAFHDQLTGLPNRSSLKEDIQEIVKNASLNKESFSLMYIDLDRFKFLNDTMGHNNGDLLLKEVAKRLTTLGSDKKTNVYRQGGDEFILIILNTTPVETREIAEKVIKLFHIPFLLQNQEFYVTSSLGISIFPANGMDGESLIKNADTALYQVKERGRGNYQFYLDDMQKGDSRTMLIETCLRKAIEKKELVLYYQPQVDLQTMEVTSFEALIRWDCKLLGFLEPSAFIPLAEETGLIHSIGEWVIEEVSKKLKAWKEKGITDVTIALNLSAKQFQQPNLVEIIKNAIEKNNLHPGQLEVEITEGAMQDTKETVTILNRLQGLGVQIAVDDFGTGYSSLSYLKQFPINTLKIDRSFVEDVLTDQKNAAITTTIIHLAQSLGLNVIAEGVELVEQADFLRRMECKKAQGYLFSRPLTEKQIEDTYFN
jgi:diguanylate cyclase (GGDEF)-like protein/PAS domain S-box-containing protein